MFKYPTCEVCSSNCLSPHRLYAYEGYIEWLDNTTKRADPAPGQERDRMLSLISKADAEYGPGYIAGRCAVCFGHWCTRPHRKVSKEGYALFLRIIDNATSVQESMRMADEKFEIDARPESFGALGGRTQSDRNGRYRDEGSVLDWEVENEIMFQMKRWNYGTLRCSPQDIERFRDLIKGEWIRKVNYDSQKYGRMPWDDIPWETMHKMPARPEDAIPWDRLKDLAPQQEKEVIFFKLRRLVPRPELEPGLRPPVRSGPGSSQNQSVSPSPPPQSSPNIHSTVPPQGPHEPTAGPGDENHKNARSLYCRPGDKSYEMAHRRYYRPGHEKYENARLLYSTKWTNRRELAMSADEIKGLRATAQTSWEKHVGPIAKYENMPWRRDGLRKPPCRVLCEFFPPQKAALSRALQVFYTVGAVGERPNRMLIECFFREWSDMAFPEGGNACEDPMQRYAMARIMQASYESIVRTRSEGEMDDMPWAEDLIYPVPEAREAQPQSQPQPQTPNDPLPGTSSEMDYTLLCAAFTAIFLNRTKGKYLLDVEDQAIIFRDVWVRELGVRAPDVRMPWDMVLHRKADRNIRMEWLGWKWWAGIW
ncbi:hypothetical protein VE03_01182 [Pseudogymnoascus sp. 23342-1-I1]|nr:hypothetical protein VE03_01182 [Pseudogymnoascus sp. 23342-1-I1]